MDLLCGLYAKMNSFLFTPQFFIRRFINVTELFFERDEEITHSNEHTLRGGRHVKRTGTKKGGGASIIGNFEGTHFLNAPLENYHLIDDANGMLISFYLII